MLQTPLLPGLLSGLQAPSAFLAFGTAATGSGMPDGIKRPVAPGPLNPVLLRQHTTTLTGMATIDTLGDSCTTLMLTTTHEVRGTLEGCDLAISVMGRSPTHAMLTVKELWPGIKIHLVSRQPEWSDEHHVSVH